MTNCCLQGLPVLGVDNSLSPLVGLGGQMNYTVDDLAALQSPVFPISPQQMQQQQQLQQGQPLSSSNIGPAGIHHQQLSGATVPRLQEALLAANLGGGDASNPRLFSAPGTLDNTGYTRFNLHANPLNQQQAAAHQHAHQAVVGQHGARAGQQFGGHHMSSYNSCPLDVGSILRAQLAAETAMPGPPHAGLAQNLPWTGSLGPGHEAGSNSHLLPHGFDPTVRRPDFGEAPPATTGAQLVEPYLFSQVPDLHKTILHGPMRRFPSAARNMRSAPY